MTPRLITPIGAVGVAVTVFALLAASYFLAKTPGDVLGEDLVPLAQVATDREEVGYTLPAGRSAGDIGSDLERLGVIGSGQQFEFLVSLVGVQQRLSTGDYLLRKNSSALTVVRELTVKEQIPVLKVTFPEGIRIEEMAIIAEKAGFGSRESFMAATKAAELPPGFVEAFPAGESLQGYLFPDTYIMPVGSTAEMLVDYMLRTLDRRFSPELRLAAKSQGLNTHQALTLASIVEREAVLEPERARIAGVFYNRLAAQDMLGADPTVQYAVSLIAGSVEQFGYWKKDLTLVDLKLASPYNTREVPGLPPGPIANPGLASIEAVANPEKTDFYYFVADAKANDGSHVFAVTLAEHERNIQQYGTP
ncbi:endolytic transglycosylase MltG [Candidatus Amarobacter glycogenicus]|uniref:endolytic transglycosylase MltG n=1 Tax=Candidatus Amarobacter glycogenicus TaxID=3140699 RepID=UPI003134A306|nr:endolytic transglycosylase MltG [Dehalococcoidia bacterium]